MKQFAVVIGRFAPVHNEHINCIFHEAAKYEKVLVLLGSAYRALTPKNPFMPYSRERMIRYSLEEAGIHVSDEKFTFVPLKDYLYSDNRWMLQVQKIVDNFQSSITTSTPLEWEPVLIGVNKDDSSYYLKLFPQWKTKVTKPERDVSSTQIREAMFEGRLEDVRHLISPLTYNYIKDNWMKYSNFTVLQKEYFARQKARSKLFFVDKNGNLALDQNGKPKPCPYEPTAYCTDNVVTWRGHILLIRRRSEPGKGLWALPGGHLNPNEWVKEGAIRELQEETHIYFFKNGIDKEIRRLYLSSDWCKSSRQFDFPGRSELGRKITTAFHWVIPDEFEVSVQADDDADRAQWFSFYQVLEKMDYEIFEDHQQIIAQMILGAPL